ncbi:cytidylyltransferase domain-containing protein [Thermodesulfobacteriota bacterium]
MKIGFLITGRLKSKRLPQKVILEICGKPLFSHLCDRLRRTSCIDEIILCTSTHTQDDPLVDLAHNEGIHAFRGSEEDVLQRLCDAARLFNLDYALNITADCPLVDPLFIDKTFEGYVSNRADVVRMSDLPLGQAPYGIRVEALSKVCELKDEVETEVWGVYFKNNKLFLYEDLPVEKKYQYPGLKTTIDYPEDYEFFKKLFDELYRPDDIFTFDQILSLVRKKPDLVKINSHCIGLGVDHIRKTASPARFKGHI